MAVQLGQASSQEAIDTLWGAGKEEGGMPTANIASVISCPMALMTPT